MLFNPLRGLRRGGANGSFWPIAAIEKTQNSTI
jgi:hypothetical protein